MSDVQQQSGRRGGRAARVALRSAPLANDVRPVNPGMPSGRYQPLTDAEVRKVHEAALNVLENIGLADAIDSCLDVLLPKGCTLSEDGRLLFPRSLIEDTLAIAARNFTLHAQDPQFDMEPWGKKVYFGTAGAAVYMVDPITGEYRESLSHAMVVDGGATALDFVGDILMGPVREALGNAVGVLADPSIGRAINAGNSVHVDFAQKNANVVSG